jgi:hypothetical protein
MIDLRRSFRSPRPHSPFKRHRLHRRLSRRLTNDRPCAGDRPPIFPVPAGAVRPILDRMHEFCRAREMTYRADESPQKPGVWVRGLVLCQPDTCARVSLPVWRRTDHGHRGVQGRKDVTVTRLDCGRRDDECVACNYRGITRYGHIPIFGHHQPAWNQWCSSSCSTISEMPRTMSANHNAYQIACVLKCTGRRWRLRTPLGPRFPSARFPARARQPAWARVFALARNEICR